MRVYRRLALWKLIALTTNCTLFCCALRLACADIRTSEDKVLTRVSVHRRRTAKEDGAACRASCEHWTSVTVHACPLCAQTSSSLCAFPRHVSTWPCYGWGGLVHAHRAIGRCCRCPAVVRSGIVPMGLVGSCPAVSGVLPFDQKVRAIRRTQYVP